MSFSNDVEKFSKESLVIADKVRREFILKLFTAIIKDTPVDKGRLRANWITSVARPSRKKINTADKTGGKAISKINANLGDLDDTVYLSNNLPYVNRIEYDGYSKIKAPAGMVRKNVARAASIMKQITRKYE